ncbi:MAG: hypothetical protein ACMUJM_25460 [bacterium]
MGVGFRYGCLRVCAEKRCSLRKPCDATSGAALARGRRDLAEGVLVQAT